MQTELMRMASAAQKFTAEVWTAITAHNKIQVEKEEHQVTTMTRLKDTVQLLQVTNRK